MASDNDNLPAAPPVAFRLRWDVFLSFRGEDTRETIAKDIYDALQKHGVRVFLDNDGLNRGDEIAPGLEEAIEDSAACIVVFSPRYSDSRWCLEELTKIWECRRLILPVFYGVNPSDVRRQRGPLEEHFRNHEERFGKEKVLRWRKAMEKIGGISGFDLWVFNNSEETEKVQSLVKRVLNEISNTPVGVAAHTVGLDSRIQKQMKVLDVDSNGTQILGLHGIGGVGKTTLAKALFNKLAGHFTSRSFISNVREISAQGDIGLIYLQNKLINDLFHEKMSTGNDISSGIAEIIKKVKEKQVLIVLDDVDNVSQLNALSGHRDWFKEGSRIIITTRDTEVFTNHLGTELYEVRELDWDEALELFSFHAFRREKPIEKFMDLSQKIVSLTGRLPLALEVFGSSLFDKRRIEEWRDALQKLKDIRPLNLQNVLKLSYDGLDEEEKCIFLDIACLFVEMDMKREYAIDIWKGCGFAAEIAISDLTAKSLIKIAEKKTLWMHDQVRDMGRQIVRLENLEDPCMRSRLWDPNEIVPILKDEYHYKGEKPIRGMVLDLGKKSSVEVEDGSGDAIISRNKFQRNPNFTTVSTAYNKQKIKQNLRKQADREEEEIVISTKAIENMSKLRLLQINHVNFQGKFKSLPLLKWLQWKGCPFKALPYDFYPPQLAVLDVSESQIQKLWDSNKVAKNLISLNLSECHAIVAIPDLSGHQKLEKLIFKRCTKLEKIHESIGNMNSLICLNLRGCSNLTELPTFVSGLKQLENLILSGCSKLKHLPQNIGSMKALRKLLIDGTAISNLPKSIFHLTQLEKLSLNSCVQLKRLPWCIGQLVSLKKLFLNGSGLEELPDSIGSLANLEELSIMWCSSLTVLPDSIKNLKSLTEFFVLGSPIKELPVLSVGSLPNLKELSVGKGLYLKELPDSIQHLNSMVVLQIVGTSITGFPDQIGDLKLLEKLEMRSCRFLTSLPASIGGLTRLITLIIYEAAITELPESIGMLENLIMLQLTKCKMLIELPSSIGRLTSLQCLLMEETAVTELPESFGRLSSLTFLKMSRAPHVQDLPANRTHIEREVEHAVIPTSFSNLSLLNGFYARACNISGKIADDFEKLSSLEILDLSHNQFSCLPSSLRGLSILKQLILPYCKKLKSLPPLPSSLLELNVANCGSLETISDLSNLGSLDHLNLANCEKVLDIPGLECLKSLTRLYMTSCNACSSVVKRILYKGYLGNIHNLSMPGNKIPDWLSQEEVTFSECRNRVIKEVIIGVVVSLNHQLPDYFRNQLPAIVDIQAKILKQVYPIYISTLNLVGVPSSDDGQVYLCRYSVDHPMVSLLKDGYKIQVTKRDPPIMKGLELKKIGIHLVYDGDDDYEGDEEALKVSHPSISESLKEYEYSSESSGEVKNEVQKLEIREHKTPALSRGILISCFIILPIIFILFAWFYSSGLSLNSHKSYELN